MSAEGAVGNAGHVLPPGLSEEEAEELRTELVKVSYHATYAYQSQ